MKFVKKFGDKFKAGLDTLYPSAKSLGTFLILSVLYGFAPWYAGIVLVAAILLVASVGAVASYINRTSPRDSYQAMFPEVSFVEGVPKFNMKTHSFNNRLSLVAQFTLLSFNLLFEPFSIVLNYVLVSLAAPYYAYQAHRDTAAAENAFAPKNDNTDGASAEPSQTVHVLGSPVAIDALRTSAEVKMQRDDNIPLVPALANDEQHQFEPSH